MIYLNRLSTVLLIFFFASACADIAEPKFSRSDCIAKVELDWEDSVDLPTREKVRQAIGDAISRTIADGSGLPRPSISYKGSDKELLYLQYRNQCDKKIEITNQLLTQHVAPRVSGFPVYNVSNEAVIPSTNTIEVYGPYWVDGDIEIPPGSTGVKISHPSGKMENLDK